MGVQVADIAQSAKQLLTLHTALCSCEASGSSRSVGVRLGTVTSLKYNAISMVASLGWFCSQQILFKNLSAQSNILCITFPPDISPVHS